MTTQTQTILKITPAEGMHIRCIATGEVFPDYIYPAVGLTPADFDEVDEAAYQAYIAERDAAAEAEAEAENPS